jgi:hypothetical protein
LSKQFRPSKGPQIATNTDVTISIAEDEGVSPVSITETGTKEKLDELAASLVSKAAAWAAANK